MTNQEMEQRLAEALAKCTPNDLEGILSHCSTQKGYIIPMRKKLTSLIAACLLLVLCAGGTFYYQSTHAVASVVSLDVNPSIELKINRHEKVLSCTPLNEDAFKVLSDMDNGKDLKGIKLDVAVNAIVGSLVRNGYVTDDSSAISISVKDKDETRAVKLKEEVIKTVNTVLRERSLSSAAKIPEESQSSENQSAVNQPNPPSPTSKGTTPSQPGLIGEEKAKSIALTHAGITENTLTYCKSYLDYDDGIPEHYEVEFLAGNTEYEYEIDPYSGAILKEEKEQKPAEVSYIGVSYIGDNSAADIAFSHAGVNASSVRELEVELDEEDGKMVYEIDFKSGNMEYEYVIDAITGSVLEHESEIED